MSVFLLSVEPMRIIMGMLHAEVGHQNFIQLVNRRVWTEPNERDPSGPLLPLLFRSSVLGIMSSTQIALLWQEILLSAKPQ